MSHDYECVRHWYDEKAQTLRSQLCFPNCTVNVTPLSKWTGLVLFESDLQRFIKEMKDYTGNLTCIQNQIAIYESFSICSFHALESILQNLD